MTKLSSTAMGIWVFFCTMLMAANQPIKPTTQTHTHKKNAGVFGQAILQPEGGSDLAGTVEFQKLDTTQIRIVMTLANGEPGATYQVELVDGNRCPTNRTPKERDAGKAVQLPATQQLGSVKITEGKAGVASVNRKEAVEIKPGQNGYVNKMVVVKEFNSAKTSWLACGVVDPTEQAAE